MLQYVAAYFCFLQHIPDALLVIPSVVEVYSIFYISYSKSFHSIPTQSSMLHVASFVF